MRITVKLFAYFRDNRFVAEVREYPDDSTVAAIAGELGIDLEEIGITMLNSKQCRLESRPADGDTLALFPVVGGG